VASIAPMVATRHSGASADQAMMGVDDDLLTVDDIARILKLNPQTVRNWIDRGELPAIRIGRRVQIRRADFDATVEAGYSGAQQSPAPSTPQGTIWDGVIPPPVMTAD
jgi:excisionase family DNA binding protein